MKTAARWVVLSVVYVVAQALPGVLMPVEIWGTGSGAAQAASPQPWQLLAYLAATLPMLAYLVHRPKVRGVKQLGLVALFVWGVQTFMTQIETAYFWSAFPGVSGVQMFFLFARNLVTIAVFLPLAFWMTGRLRSDGGEVESGLSLDATLAWKLPLLGAGYVVLYFVFGYFVAWQIEGIRVFYTGSAVLDGFVGQLQGTVSQRPFIVPFQFLRGILWIAVAWPLLASLGRSRLEQVIAGAVLVGLFPTVQLVFENPLMPAAVRLGHFIEVTSSMMIFGALTAWVMGLRGAPRTAGNSLRSPPVAVRR